ncbi:MAG TPA: hypothetical protein VGH32_12150 [Pirellulales bacterium]
MIGQPPNSDVQRIAVFADAVLDFGLIGVIADKIPFLPLVRFFADVEDLCRDDVPPFSEPAVHMFAVQEFGFRPQMILSERLGVGDQQCWRDGLSSFPIKCVMGRLRDVPIERRNWFDVDLLSRPPALRNRRLVSMGQFKLRAGLKRIQEIERLHLIGQFAHAVVLTKPLQ